MRIAKAMTLTDEERMTLTKWSRGRSTRARLVVRAQIVLAAADGRENKDIAAEPGCTRRTIGIWRNRFAAERLQGITHDAPRGGRKATQRDAFEAEIIPKTTQELPPNATQWSTRLLANALECRRRFATTSTIIMPTQNCSSGSGRPRRSWKKSLVPESH